MLETMKTHNNTLSSVTKLTLAAAAGLLSTVGVASAAPTTLTPSDYGWGYQFFGNAAMRSFGGGVYSNYLPAAYTGLGHDCYAFLKFNLSGVTLDAGEVAVLRLYSTGKGSNVFPTGGVVPGQNTTSGIAKSAVAATPITESWVGAGASYTNMLPKFPVASGPEVVTVDAINTWFEINVTSDLQAFLAAPTTNFGWALSRELLDGQTINTYPFMLPVFDSQGATAAQLVIRPIPEPATAGLLVAALPLLAARRRRA